MFIGLRVGRHTSLKPFQKGLLLSNASLKYILPYLQNKYNNKFKIEYLITRRFNQDIIENFFSYIRRMGHNYDHPPPLEFSNRLRKYILSKHSSAIFAIDKNCRDDDTNDINLVSLNQTIHSSNLEQTQISPVVDTSR